MFPLVHVRQVNLAVLVHMFACLDLHTAGWFHVGHGRVVGVSVRQPDTYWYVVCAPFEKQIIKFHFPGLRKLNVKIELLPNGNEIK